MMFLFQIIQDLFIKFLFMEMLSEFVTFQLRGSEISIESVDECFIVTIWFFLLLFLRVEVVVVVFLMAVEQMVCEWVQALNWALYHLLVVHMALREVIGVVKIVWLGWEGFLLMVLEVMVIKFPKPTGPIINSGLILPLIVTVVSIIDLTFHFRLRLDHFWCQLVLVVQEHGTTCHWFVWQFVKAGRCVVGLCWRMRFIVHVVVRMYSVNCWVRCRVVLMVIVIIVVVLMVQHRFHHARRWVLLWALVMNHEVLIVLNVLLVKTVRSVFLNRLYKSVVTRGLLSLHRALCLIGSFLLDLDVVFIIAVYTLCPLAWHLMVILPIERLPGILMWRTWTKWRPNVDLEVMSIAWGWLVVWGLLAWLLGNVVLVIVLGLLSLVNYRLLDLFHIILLFNLVVLSYFVRVVLLYADFLCLVLLLRILDETSFLIVRWDHSQTWGLSLMAWVFIDLRILLITIALGRINLTVG